MTSTRDLILIKLGGSSLQDPKIVNSICHDIEQVVNRGQKIILVHGGGPAINEALTAKNIQWEFVDGQRKTTSAMIEVIESVLCGQVNRSIVKCLNTMGIPALGLSGSDMKILNCKLMNEKLGFVGEVDRVNVSPLLSLLFDMKMNVVPVLAPVGTDDSGQLYNVNADMAASAVAAALNVKKLIFMTDQDGILDQNKMLIRQIESLGLYQLIETGIVSGGMLAKVKAVLNALKKEVPHVQIINAKKSHSLLDTLLQPERIGTNCFRD